MLELFGMFVFAPPTHHLARDSALRLHMEAHKASLGALVVAAFCALVGWKMTVVNSRDRGTRGFAMALWPSSSSSSLPCLSVFTYNLTVHTGAMEKSRPCSARCRPTCAFW